MTAPAVYGLSNDAAIFVAPPFGKIVAYQERETFGVLRKVLDLVSVEDGVGEQHITTLQVVKGSLGEVRLDAYLTHDGTRYRVLSYVGDDTGWFEVFRVTEATR